MIHLVFIRYNIIDIYGGSLINKSIIDLEEKLEKSNLLNMFNKLLKLTVSTTRL